jgi:hypothetical protein
MSKATSAERWQSGLMRQIANLVTPPGVRGFKSPLLRHFHPMPKPLPTAIPAALLLALGCTGCVVEKTLTIQSDPPGALVRLGEEDLGTTPVTVPFLHYGTQRLGLELAGYARVERDLRISPPWYGRFPMDFVSEVLLPFGWEDHRGVTLLLQPTSGRIAEDEYNSARARAEAFRTAGDQPPEDLPPLAASEMGLIDAEPLR